jgi:hypothetical protein
VHGVARQLMKQKAREICQIAGPDDPSNPAKPESLMAAVSSLHRAPNCAHPACAFTGTSHHDFLAASARHFGLRGCLPLPITLGDVSSGVSEWMDPRALRWEKYHSQANE